MSIEEKLKGRLKKPTFPPVWRPQRIGDNIMGKVIRVRNSPWPSKTEYDKYIFEVQLLNSKEVISLPLHTILMRMMVEEGAKAEDYIMVRYVGESRSKQGRLVKSYEVAVLPKEEVEAIQTSVPQPLVETKPTAQPVTATVTSTAIPSTPTVPPTPSVISKTGLGERLEEIRRFIEELFSYYDSLSVEELNYYLNTIKKWNIDPAIVIKELGLKIEGDKVTR